MSTAEVSDYWSSWSRATPLKLEAQGGPSRRTFPSLNNPRANNIQSLAQYFPCKTFHHGISAPYLTERGDPYHFTLATMKKSRSNKFHMLHRIPSPQQQPPLQSALAQAWTLEQEGILSP
tara:strand:+ start:2101 stop:2460 length:360 start_codon:yes stop_codon:yes gene_type:complete